MPHFTKREKHVAVIVLIAMMLVFAFGDRWQSSEAAEHIFLIFFVLPLGAYIAIDKERINRRNL